MTDSLIDRDNAAVAAKIMHARCPSMNGQKVLLTQLLRSIEVAEALAADSWAVTLFDNGFRLNVGPVEVFAFIDGAVRMLLLETRPAKASAFVRTSKYKSMPNPQYTFRGDMRTFIRLASILQPAHAKWVRTAAVTSDGKPRRTAYAKSNSPGLVSYAKSLTRA